MKALGKKPITKIVCSCEEYKELSCECDCSCLINEQSEHYRQALLEAAEELEQPHPCKENLSLIENYCHRCKVARKLRISAGVGKE